jgi:hypothetical protein
LPHRKWQIHHPTPEERDEPTSLYPLDPEEALAALLKVDPESEPAEDHGTDG